LSCGKKKYEDKSNRNNTSEVGIEKAAQDVTFQVSGPKPSDEFQTEDVKAFTARVGDYVQEGSNNTLFLMSRDRVDTPDSGQKKKAGAIFLVSGRADEEKLNWKDDKSFLVISMNSDADGNMNIQAGDNAGAAAVIAARSDQIRISARKGMKIVVDQGDIYIKNDGKITLESTGEINVKTPNGTVNVEASKVNVGGQDASAVLGEALKSDLTSAMSTILGHTHETPMGGTAIVSPALASLSSKFQNILSNNVKLKQ
jgi:sRNA-binding protein